ncbi:hypothetical protein RRG08_024354 [Elysia crispata]|uniref:Uncharacterized protein n=1 Tax=Elysia crispata TaxID=231223 RepID=A0AAE0ZKZ7_9GAST|nr:hypothetical protein RRG08_024354 [Elysia crispata]
MDQSTELKPTAFRTGNGETDVSILWRQKVDTRKRPSLSTPTPFVLFIKFRGITIIPLPLSFPGPLPGGTPSESGMSLCGNDFGQCCQYS